jgi:hypothetical protein
MTPEQVKAQQTFLVLACGLVGGVTARLFDEPSPDGFRLTPLTVGGAVAGLAVGFLLRLDHVRLLRRLEATPDAPPAAPGVGWPAGLMLALPAAAVGVFWLTWLTPAPVPPAVGSALTAAAVPATVLLAYLDARRLLLAAPRPLPAGAEFQPVGSAGTVGFLWPIGFPMHFVARRRLGGSRAFVPAGVVVTLACLTPLLARWTQTLPLPAPDSQAVRAYVGRMLAPGYALGPVEDLGPAADGTARRGRATLRGPGGDEPEKFVVTWQDRPAGRFWVQFTGPADRP